MATETQQPKAKVQVTNPVQQSDPFAFLYALPIDEAYAQIRKALEKLAELHETSSCKSERRGLEHSDSCQGAVFASAAHHLAVMHGDRCKRRP